MTNYLEDIKHLIPPNLGAWDTGESLTYALRDAGRKGLLSGTYADKLYAEVQSSLDRFDFLIKTADKSAPDYVQRYMELSKHYFHVRQFFDDYVFALWPNISSLKIKSHVE